MLCDSYGSYKTVWLNVSADHEIHCLTSGNVNGLPVCVLHGGLGDMA